PGRSDVARARTRADRRTGASDHVDREEDVLRRAVGWRVTDMPEVAEVDPGDLKSYFRRIEASALGVAGQDDRRGNIALRAAVRGLAALARGRRAVDGIVPAAAERRIADRRGNSGQPRRDDVRPEVAQDARRLVGLEDQPVVVGVGFLT